MASNERYEKMVYRRCGDKGLFLPLISLGMWHSFGTKDKIENCRKLVLTAFENGITHLDNANNYGPPPGSSERRLGEILKKDLKFHRHELIISTKAGHLMWEGPYGSWGSRKHLFNSIDHSLTRLGQDYVDIFYHHRPDPETSIEETAVALHDIVKSGKALYVGLSRYPSDMTDKIMKIFKELKTPVVIHQNSYSMLKRTIEVNRIKNIEKHKLGLIVYSPLAQGLLTDKYLNSIPRSSRASRKAGNLSKDDITLKLVKKLNRLNSIAANRGITLAQLALLWILRHPQVTSILMGASRMSQITENLKVIDMHQLSQTELKKINTILGV